MRRRHAGERVEPFRRRLHAPDGHRVRDAIEAWAAAQSGTMSWPVLPPEIQDRDADVWEALMMVANAVGGEWPERTRKAAVALLEASKEAEPSLGVRLLADLQSTFGDAIAMATEDVLTALHAMKESPWADLRGKPLNDRGLATRLRQYGVKSKQIRLGHRTLKGYVRADLHDAWKRYLPPAHNSETSETKETVSEQTVSDVSHVSHLAGDRGETSRPRCAQCGQGGYVNQCSISGTEAWLHPGCEAAWGSKLPLNDGLGIPDFLERKKAQAQ
jgi:hypothetical protein